MKPGHEKAGYIDVVRCVGTDDLGNRFYEDFDADSKEFNFQRKIKDVGQNTLTMENGILLQSPSLQDGQDGFAICMMTHRMISILSILIIDRSEHII